MAPRNRIASRIKPDPIARAVVAGTAPPKKIQACAPRPDWDSSRPTEIRCVAAALAYASASSRAVGPSKSAARKWQELSRASG